MLTVFSLLELDAHELISKIAISAEEIILSRFIILYFKKLQDKIQNKKGFLKQLNVAFLKLRF
jgi:hypothetical protein